MLKKIMFFSFVTMFFIQTSFSNRNSNVIHVSPGATITIGDQTFMCEPGTSIGQQQPTYHAIRLGCLCELQPSFSLNWILKLYQYSNNEPPKFLQSLESGIPSQDKCSESIKKYSQCR